MNPTDKPYLIDVNAAVEKIRSFNMLNGEFIINLLQNEPRVQLQQEDQDLVDDCRMLTVS